MGLIRSMIPPFIAVGIAWLPTSQDTFPSGVVTLAQRLQNIRSKCSRSKSRFPAEEAQVLDLAPNSGPICTHSQSAVFLIVNIKESFERPALIYLSIYLMINQEGTCLCKTLSIMHHSFSSYPYFYTRCWYVNGRKVKLGTHKGKILNEELWCDCHNSELCLLRSHLTPHHR